MKSGRKNVKTTMIHTGHNGIKKEDIRNVYDDICVSTYPNNYCIWNTQEDYEVELILISTLN